MMPSMIERLNHAGHQPLNYLDFLLSRVAWLCASFNTSSKLISIVTHSLSLPVSLSVKEEMYGFAGQASVKAI